MKERIGWKSWGKVLEYADGRKTDLRWIYHQNHKNKQN